VLVFKLVQLTKNNNFSSIIGLKLAANYIKIVVFFIVYLKTTKNKYPTPSPHLLPVKSHAFKTIMRLQN